MSFYQDTLGHKLRDARRQAGFSLSKLEEATKGEFKASAVGAYERGERAISVTKLADLCRVYGTTPKAVIPRDETLNPQITQSETRITDNGTDVVYKMPPYIAEELAVVLNHAAIHEPSTSLRKPAKYDQGWILDAENLREAATEIRRVV